MLGDTPVGDARSWPTARPTRCWEKNRRGAGDDFPEGRHQAISAGTEAVVGMVGREAEAQLVDRLIDGLHEGGGALIVRGEPGIGKSALLEHARECVIAAGGRVLSTVAVESEAELAFAGLHQLHQLHQLCRAASHPRADRTPVACPATGDRRGVWRQWRGRAGPVSRRARKRAAKAGSGSIGVRAVRSASNGSGKVGILLLGVGAAERQPGAHCSGLDSVDDERRARSARSRESYNLRQLSRPMTRFWGGQPVWRRIMLPVLRATPSARFTRPCATPRTATSGWVVSTSGRSLFRRVC